MVLNQSKTEVVDEPLDIGQQLIHERWHNLLLWRVCICLAICSILALSVALIFAGMYFNITDSQDKSKTVGCALLRVHDLKHAELEELGC